MLQNDFDDLLSANRRYANSAPREFDGIAHAGVAIVTCMDSRLQPLEMIGLYLGEAKIMRTPGGHVTEDALRGCVLSVHFLRVKRILVIEHTRCAMANDETTLRDRLHCEVGDAANAFFIGADPDQHGRIARDVAKLREHELIRGKASVGGFLYDVDTGLLTQIA